MFRCTLDNGDKLHEATSHFLEEAVDLQSVAGIVAVHGGKSIELDSIFFQEAEGLQDPVKAACAAFVHAIAVVEVARAIQREADEEVVSGQEFAPDIVEHNSVSLKRVLDPFSVSVLLLESDGIFKKIDSQQGGLASLPCEIYDLTWLRCDVLSDISFQDAFRHDPFLHAPLGRKEHSLLKVKAISTGQIAEGADRLSQYVKASIIDFLQNVQISACISDLGC